MHYALYVYVVVPFLVYFLYFINKTFVKVRILFSFFVPLSFFFFIIIKFGYSLCVFHKIAYTEYTFLSEYNFSRKLRNTKFVNVDAVILYRLEKST